MARGKVAIYLVFYHKDFKRVSQKTGPQANPKNREEYKLIKAEALEKVRKIEKDF